MESANEKSGPNWRTPGIPIEIPGRSRNDEDFRQEQIANWVQDNINAGRGSLSRNSSEVFNLIEDSTDSRISSGILQNKSPTPGASAVKVYTFDRRPTLPREFVAKCRGISEECAGFADEVDISAIEVSKVSEKLWRETENVLPKIPSHPSVDELRRQPGKI